MNCNDALLKLYDYIDGEIRTPEREAIAAHLSDCRECFTAFESETVFREFVVSHAPRPQARAEFKSHLLTRLAAERNTAPFVLPLPTNVVSIFKRYAVAAVVLLGLGLGAAWMNRRLGNDNSAWASLAYIHHEKSKAEQVAFETGDYREAKAFLNAQMGSQMSGLLPDSTPTGVSTEKSCVVSWNQCRVAHMAFNAGQSGAVSLFVIPASSFPLKNEPRVQVGDRMYRSVKLGCCRAVLWPSQGGYVCVLLGDCHANNLLAYAETWQAMMAAQPTSGNPAWGGSLQSPR